MGSALVPAFDSDSLRSKKKKLSHSIQNLCCCWFQIFSKPSELLSRIPTLPKSYKYGRRRQRQEFSQFSTSRLFTWLGCCPFLLLFAFLFAVASLPLVFAGAIV